ncbi:hypothetical protein RKD18_000312 [Streptomyces phaeoluteigriseus]
MERGSPAVRQQSIGNSSGLAQVALWVCHGRAHTTRPATTRAASIRTRLGSTRRTSSPPQPPPSARPSPPARSRPPARRTPPSAASAASRPPASRHAPTLPCAAPASRWPSPCPWSGSPPPQATSRPCGPTHRPAPRRASLKPPAPPSRCAPPGVPPPCGRTVDGAISGFAISHSPSGTSQRHVPRPIRGSTSLHHVGHRLNAADRRPRHRPHRLLRPPRSEDGPQLSRTASTTDVLTADALRVRHR